MGRRTFKDTARNYRLPVGEGVRERGGQEDVRTRNNMLSKLVGLLHP